MVATFIADRLSLLPLQVQIGPANAALLVGESVRCAKIEPQSPRLLVQLYRHHIKVEVVAQDYLL